VKLSNGSILVPDGAAYTNKNWQTTDGAMHEVYTGILYLMDILAGVDLFWREKRGRMRIANSQDPAALIGLANLLDGQVDDVRCPPLSDTND
jgi:hypothetical protein